MLWQSQQSKKENRVKKNDIFLTAAVLAGALLLFLVMNLAGNQTGSKIRITVDGKEYGTYSLTKDQSIEVNENGNYNRIQIRDGKAFMEEADCPDGYCKRQGKISGHTQTIVCLPHKLVVEVIGDEADESPADAPDVIAK